jgi:hypothetical protein
MRLFGGRQRIVAAINNRRRQQLTSICAPNEALVDKVISDACEKGAERNFSLKFLLIRRKFL